jgi:hypothetical protein
MDFSLMKKWSPAFLGEDGNLEFRSEFFNAFNRANYGTPSMTVFDGRGRSRSSAGRITSTATTERQIQLGLKIIF